MGGMHMNRSLWRKAVALTLTAAMTAGLTACGGGGNSTSADGKKRYFKADYLSDLPDSFNDTTSDIQFKGDVMYYTSSNEDYTKSGLYSYNLITGEMHSFMSRRRVTAAETAAGCQDIPWQTAERFTCL